MSGFMLWAIAVTLAMANFVAILDITIANVALPTIAGSLGITPSQAVWLITSYAVAEAVSVPLTGWLATRFGSVRVMSVSMAAFGIFSLQCGLSHTFGLLIAGRIVQGWSGGLMMALSQTLLMRVFPRNQVGVAMAIWMIPSLFAPVLGPVIGGWLCETFSWPLIFFINVPIAAVCSFLIWRLLKTYQEKTSRAPIDIIGFVLLAVFVGALQIMLDIGKEHDWFGSWEVRILAVTAVIGFVAFLFWELTDEHPIVNLRVFRHRGFITSVFVQATVFGAGFCGLVLTPLWLQTYMGYSATMAGLTMAWNAALGVFMAPLSGLLLGRVDGRIISCVGLLWVVGTMWFRSNCTTDMTNFQIAWPILLMGAGLPVVFVPLTTLSLRSVDENETASAAGLQNFVRTVFGAFATSIATTAWDYRTTHARTVLSGVVDSQGLQAAGVNGDMSVRVIDNMVQTQSAMIGLNQVMMATMFTFFICALLVWITPKPTHTIDMTRIGH